MAGLYAFDTKELILKLKNSTEDDGNEFSSSLFGNDIYYQMVGEDCLKIGYTQEKTDLEEKIGAQKQKQNDEVLARKRDLVFIQQDIDTILNSIQKQTQEPSYIQDLGDLLALKEGHEQEISNVKDPHQEIVYNTVFHRQYVILKLGEVYDFKNFLGNVHINVVFRKKPFPIHLLRRLDVQVDYKACTKNEGRTTYFDQRCFIFCKRADKTVYIYRGDGRLFRKISSESELNAVVSTDTDIPMFLSVVRKNYKRSIEALGVVGKSMVSFRLKTQDDTVSVVRGANRMYVSGRSGVTVTDLCGKYIFYIPVSPAIRLETCVYFGEVLFFLGDGNYVSSYFASGEFKCKFTVGESPKLRILADLVVSEEGVFAADILNKTVSVHDFEGKWKYDISTENDSGIACLGVCQGRMFIFDHHDAEIKVYKIGEDRADFLFAFPGASESNSPLREISCLIDTRY